MYNDQISHRIFHHFENRAHKGSCVLAGCESAVYSTKHNHDTWESGFSCWPNSCLIALSNSS